MTLRAASFLGENTGPLLRDVVEQIQGAGVDITVDATVSVQEADLVFACGLMTRVLISQGEDLHVIAAPIFPGEVRPVYRSVLVTRTGHDAELRVSVTERLAINEYDSWSGWHGFRHHLLVRGLTPNQSRLETGSHVESMRAVRDGRADLAAIDSSIWHFHAGNSIRRGLTILDTTDDWPSPPISIHGRVAEEIRAEVSTIIAGRPNFQPIGETVYDPMIDAVAKLDLQ